MGDHSTTSAIPIHEASRPPAEVASLTSLERVDYLDAFAVAAEGTESWTAEQWARFVLEEASRAARWRLLCAWTVLGLKLDPSDHERVLGWRIRRRSRTHVVLSAASRIGMPGEVAFALVGDRWWLSTFVTTGNRVGRVVWGGVESGHRRTVASLLSDAAMRARHQ